MRPHPHPALWLALASACIVYVPTDEPPDDTWCEDTGCEPPEPPVQCTSGIKGDPIPAPGETEVYVQPTISMELLADESATGGLLALYEGTFGADAFPSTPPIALETPRFDEAGKTVSVRPDAPLKADTAHTLVVAMSCDRTAVIPFTTMDVGDPVTSEQIVGTTFALDLGSADIVEPAGIGSLLRSLLTDVTETVALSPTAVDDGDLSILGALVDGETVDTDVVWTQTCTQTLPFDPAVAFDDNPFFSLETDTLPITVADLTITLEDVALSGAFLPDASGIVGLNVAALIDTRALLDVLGDELGAGQGDDGVCNLVSQFTGGKVDCVACPDGDAETCLRVEMANAEAPAIDLALQEISSDDAEAGCPTE